MDHCIFKNVFEKNEWSFLVGWDRAVIKLRAEKKDHFI